MIYSHSVTFDYCIPPSGPWMSGRCSWTMWTGRRSLESCSDSVLTPGTRTSSSYSSGLVNLFVPAVKYNESLFFSPQGTGDVLEEIEDEERSKASIVEIHKDSWNMNSCIFPLFCNRFHYHGCWNWIDWCRIWNGKSKFHFSSVFPLLFTTGSVYIQHVILFIVAKVN